MVCSTPYTPISSLSQSISQGSVGSLSFVLKDILRDAMVDFAVFESNPTVAVACSGGADSVALLVALHQLTMMPKNLKDFQKGKNNLLFQNLNTSEMSQNPLGGGQVVAVHVHHGLRDSAQQDADFVAQLCTRLGIDCHILHWNHQGITTRIQERARHARYALLGDWCQTQGILHLCIAHHADDQAETVLMRQHANSGQLGLAGMNACVYHPWGRLLRPLLRVDKQDCMDFLKEHALPWIEDPSNKNLYFQRVRLRQTLRDNIHEKERLLTIAKTHASQRLNLDIIIAKLMPQCAVYPHGCMAIAGDILWGKNTVSDDVKQELLVRAVYAVGGGRYRLGKKAVAPLLNALSIYTSAMATFPGVSVGGCDTIIWRDRLWIIRSWGVIRPVCLSTKISEHSVNHTIRECLWDNRFYVKKMPKGASLSPLGYKGWQNLAPTLLPHQKNQIRQTLPLSAIYSLPTVRQDGVIQGVFMVKYSTKTEINWHRPIKIASYPFSYLI